MNDTKMVLSCDAQMGSCDRCGRTTMLPAGYSPAANICDDCVAHTEAIELLRAHGLTSGTDDSLWYITYCMTPIEEDDFYRQLPGPDYDTRYEEAAEAMEHEAWLNSCTANDQGGFGYPTPEGC